MTQRARQRRLGSRGIDVSDARRHPAQGLDRRRQAAHELVIVVGIQDVVLAIVLRLRHQVGGGQPRTEIVACSRAVEAAAVGERAPREIDIGNVSPIAPAALVDQRLQAGTIGARLGAEHAIARLPLRCLRGSPRCLQCLRSRTDIGRNRVGVVGLVELRDCAHRAVDQIHLGGKRIAKQPGDAEGHIDPRPLQFRQRDHRKAGDTTGGIIPHRTRPDQRQRLRHVIAAGAHVGGAPGRQRDRPRPFTGLLPVALDQALGGQPADAPGRGTRHSAHVHGEEIPSGRQHIRPPARRRAGRPGLDETPVEAAQKGVDLRIPTTIDRRAEPLFDPRQNGTRIYPGRIWRGCARHQSESKPLDPFNGIADRSPCAVTKGRQHCRSRAVMVGCKIARQRIEIAETKIHRQCTMQRGILGPYLRARQPRNRDQQIVAPGVHRRAAKDMQPIADLHFLQVAQMRIDGAQRIRDRCIPVDTDIRIEPLRSRQ